LDNWKTRKWKSIKFDLGNQVSIPDVNLGLKNLTVYAWIKPEICIDQRAPIVRIDRFYFQFYEDNKLAAYW
jgi:hypothetical protein